MADKLSLYNQALRELGSRRLASLSEGVESRRYLDDAYDAVLRECLEEGQWNFAVRASEVHASPSVSPAFGYQFAFEKPTDLLRLMGISADERFACPLQQYSDEVGYWWADVDPIYVRYVSLDPAYGMDLSLWPPSFERYAVLALAARICMAITNSETKYDFLLKATRKARINARSKDASGQASPLMPEGSWLSSRWGGTINSRRYDRA